MPAFQSTRPLRGATGTNVAYAKYGIISIHAPLAGRDVQDGDKRAKALLFQSTRPLRGATVS